MKFIIKNRLKKYRNHSILTKSEIKNSKKILFSVFSRYGDGIISFQVIKEFILQNHDKKYLLITNIQQFPYAKEILKEFSNLTIKKVNKRNIFEFMSIIFYLKNEQYDIGYNPWGHGDDSEFYITFAKKYSFYKKFNYFSKIDNLYDRIRVYLDLKIEHNKILKPIDFMNVNKILIAPISTDITKNLSTQNLKILISQIRKKFFNANITIAIPKENIDIIKDENIEKFVFKKNIKNSQNFLEKLKDCDLFIGVDSGPLHIAIALQKQILAIFGPTSPYTILNNEQKLKILRDSRLNNIFCFVKDCENPICIDSVFKKNIFDISIGIDKYMTIEVKSCPVK